MTLATGPGQTMSIGRFNAAPRVGFGLSHGAVGGLYTIATLTSSASRSLMLQDALFFALGPPPGHHGPPLIGTLFIFRQAHLAELEGWRLTTITAFDPVLSVSLVAASPRAGLLVDPVRASRLMPAVLLSLATARQVVATLAPPGPSRCCSCAVSRRKAP